MNLTDMWRAAGQDQSWLPAKWLNQEQTKEFLNGLAVAIPGGIGFTETVRGGRAGGGATWCHWQVALAYAQYLNPDFHICSGPLQNFQGMMVGGGVDAYM